MPTRRCCCGKPNCILGEDLFNRENSNPPTGKWKVIDGEWEIYNQTLRNIEPGAIATRICHPKIYEHGSWIAEFKLISVTTVSRYVVLAGDPEDPNATIIFEPVGILTGTPRIKVTIITEEDEVDTLYNIPDPNIPIEVWVCYRPTVAIEAFVKGSGTPLRACLPEDGEPCYTHEGDKVGNFSFEEGWFDDWYYEVTDIDNIECEGCSCNCFRPTSQYNPDASCFPDEMLVTFHPVETDSLCKLPTLEIPIYKNLTIANQWRSDPQDLCNRPNEFELIANCVTQTDANGNTFGTLSLRIFHLDAIPQFSIFWENLTQPGDTMTIKFPDYELSKCSPLEIVYEFATLYTTGTSGGPDCWTNVCCPFFCGSRDLKWRVIITEMP